MSTPVYALSISAQAVLNLHSLNNEGSEGNQTQTRMVDVLTRDENGGYIESNVNAISGDMFKHMQVAHLHRIASERGWSPGGQIMIHGLPTGLVKASSKYEYDWTDGCIAVSNAAIEEIWRLVDEGTLIEITP